MKKNNGQNGITLIALVVTIVVLLILAGITITYVLQDGGIFGTAQKAASETELAVVREYASGGVIACIGRAYDPTIAEADKNYDDVMKKSFPANSFATDATLGVTVANGVVNMAQQEVTVSNKPYNVTVVDSVVTVTAVTTGSTEP